MIGFYISFGLSAVLVLYLVSQRIKKNKQLVNLHLINEFAGNKFLESISYSSLSVVYKTQ